MKARVVLSVLIPILILGAQQPLPAALVSIRLVAANSSGEAIQIARVGETFYLQAYVEDLRSRPQGVFAAYLDVDYDGSLVAPSGALRHSDDFLNGTSASLALPGRIDEVGGFSNSLVPTGPGEKLLFRAPMVGLRPGAVQFVASSADLRPFHDVLLFGRNTAVPEVDVSYTGTQVQVLAALIGDVDGNGRVDLADFHALKEYFGRSDAPFGVDIDGDGVVGLADFNVLKANFGASASPVPEPAGWPFALAGWLLGLSHWPNRCGRRVTRYAAGAELSSTMASPRHR